MTKKTNHRVMNKIYDQIHEKQKTDFASQSYITTTIRGFSQNPTNGIPNATTEKNYIQKIWDFISWKKIKNKFKKPILFILGVAVPVVFIGLISAAVVGSIAVAVALSAVTTLLAFLSFIPGAYSKSKNFLLGTLSPEYIDKKAKEMDRKKAAIESKKNTVGSLQAYLNETKDEDLKYSRKVLQKNIDLLKTSIYNQENIFDKQYSLISSAKIFKGKQKFKKAYKELDNQYNNLSNDYQESKEQCEKLLNIGPNVQTFLPTSVIYNEKNRLSGDLPKNGQFNKENNEKKTNIEDIRKKRLDYLCKGNSQIRSSSRTISNMKHL